jgi:hypothetical protein
MNIKALTLSIISVAAAVAASQPAQADEEARRPPSARWEYAPNTWRKETAITPHRWETPAPAVAVRSGAVPTGNMLGLDKTFLAKAPPAPPALPRLVAPPMVVARQQVSAVPIAVKPTTPMEAFSKAFGRPVSATPPVPMMAALPQSLPAAPAPLAASKPAAVHHVPSHRASSNLNGKLLTPQHRYGQSAGAPAALPTVASYGNKFFAPGAFTPTAGSGSNTSAVVNGRILSH